MYNGVVFFFFLVDSKARTRSNMKTIQKERILPNLGKKNSAFCHNYLQVKWAAPMEVVSIDGSHVSEDQGSMYRNTT